MAQSEEIKIVIKSEMDRAISDIEKLTKKTGESKKLFSSFTDLKSAFDAVKGGIKKVGGVIVDFAKHAAKVNTVETAFNSMMKSAGKNSIAVVDAISIAAKGTVSNLEIMKSTNLAVALMGNQVIEQLPEMAKVATAAARLHGTEASKMLNDIVVASGRQSVMILDNLGISSAEAAKYQDQYAKSLGKTRAQLNETEKAAGFFHAVQKAGGDLYLKVGDDSLTLGEKLQNLEARYKDVKDAAAGEFGKALSESIGNIQMSSKSSRELGSALGFIAGKALGVAKDFVMMNTGLTRYIVSSEMANKKFGSSFWGKQLNNVKQSAQEQVKQFEEIAKGFKKTEEKIAAEYKKTQQKKIMIDSEYLALIGMNKESELASLKEKYLRFIDEHKLTAEQMKLIDKQYVMEKEAINKSHDDKMSQSLKQKAQNILGVTSNMLGSFSELFQMNHNILMTQLEERYNKKIEILNAELVAELEAAGFAQLSKSEILQQEINDLGDKLWREDDLEKKRAYEQEIIEKEKAKKKLLIEEDYARKEEDLNTKLNEKKSELKRKHGEIMKKIAIAETIINTASAVMQAYATLPYPVAMVASVAIGATGLAKLNLIRNTPILEKGRVPSLEGGSVPDDHFLAYIGNREAVINKESTAANRGMLQAMNDNPGAAMGGKINVNLNIANLYATEDVPMNMARAIDRSLHKLNRSGNRMS